jgi:hypothetical protein
VMACAYLIWAYIVTHTTLTFVNPSIPLRGETP